MSLDERKMKILKTIISTYLETGEPVGSRTIAKDSDLHLSSATIRNEMADLEELGYIIQPHTSAGRIPSDLGNSYTFFPVRAAAFLSAYTFLKPFIGGKSTSKGKCKHLPIVPECTNTRLQNPLLAENPPIKGRPCTMICS